MNFSGGCADYVDYPLLMGGVQKEVLSDFRGRFRLPKLSDIGARYKPRDYGHIVYSSCSEMSESKFSGLVMESHAIDHFASCASHETSGVIISMRVSSKMVSAR
jgi:hypothetical protein